jgi:RNA polymerase sigma-70 factor (ECF subfamily)
MDTNYSDLDDELLLRRIQEGKHEAFAMLVNRHTNRFYNIAYRLVFNKDDTEDIVQDAFLKLWDRPEMWNQSKQAKFTTWFYKIIINLCVDHNKKKKTINLSEDIQLVDKQPGQDVLLNNQQREVLLNSFIQELPERQQLALNLCFYEELTNREAAEILGVNVKALQSLIMRAKTTLKEKVKQHLEA